MISKIFIPKVELAIPTGAVNNEANAETETQPMTAEKKVPKYEKYFKFPKVLLLTVCSYHVMYAF